MLLLPQLWGGDDTNSRIRFPTLMGGCSSRDADGVCPPLNDCLCPLSHSLPVDPVLAADGHIYEKSAIVSWLAQQNGTSPLTKEGMGAQLEPAVKFKKVLRRAVRTGVLAGEEADAWKAAISAWDRVVTMRQKADKGDARAMSQLGLWYRAGQHGLPADGFKAVEWYQRSHEAGDATGTAGLGWCYLTGLGVKASATVGLMLLSEAGSQGSKWACFNLGRFFASGSGRYGLPMDRMQARRWYAKVAGGCLNDLSASSVETAAQWLRDNPALASEAARDASATEMAVDESPRCVMAQPAHAESPRPSYDSERRSSDSGPQLPLPVYFV